MKDLPEDALPRVAAYFQALSEPTRLRVLSVLRDGEHKVGELARACGTSSANISRHLALLSQQGLVVRESRGQSAYFRLPDESVHALCDLVCGHIARQLARTAPERAAFIAPLPSSDDQAAGQGVVDQRAQGALDLRRAGPARRD